MSNGILGEVWRRYRRSRAGTIAACVIGAFYLFALFAPVLAPFDPNEQRIALRLAPPQRIELRAADGWHRPFVYGLHAERSVETGASIWSIDERERFPLLFFSQGHLVTSDGPCFLLGTDRLGRDLLSRMFFGARVSMTVGLAGVFFALLLGSLFGTASGWYGGSVDLVMQRTIELLSSFPSIPLWMALAAALPATWSALQVYLSITVILSLLGWGGIARQVRGKILAAREADYVMAARAAGAGDFYLMRRHLFPNALSHLIVTATVAIPGMILGETALSFLGLGIREPYMSWGVLLEDAQRVTVLLHNPWLLAPTIPVVITVVAWNVAGDALRDAVDPYS